MDGRAFLFLRHWRAGNVGFYRIVPALFSWNWETHLLASIRTILTFEFLIAIFPVSTVIEVLYVKWKGRPIRLSNILILRAIFFEFLGVMFILSWIFDMMLPGLYFTNEPILGLTGLILSLMIGLPILVTVPTSRIRRVREYVNRSFG